VNHRLIQHQTADIEPWPLAFSRERNYKTLKEGIYIYTYILAVQYRNLITAHLMELNFSSFKYRFLKSISLEKRP
jgi:hypothetical protein